MRRAREYAAAGLERYWIIDPVGPEVVVYELSEGGFAERGRFGPGAEVTLDVGATQITFDPATLLD